MQPTLGLSIQNKVWNAKRRYKVREVVTHEGSYWVNATGINTEPYSGSPDWVFGGSINPSSSGLNNSYKYILIAEDASSIVDVSLIGATQINMITSNSVGIIMKNDITFDSGTGTITMDVLENEEYCIFYSN